MNKELIIERYKHPLFEGEITNSKASSADNVSCGDKVTIYLNIEDNVIKEAKYKGEGCSICLASADILCEKIIGKNISDLDNVQQNLLSIMGMDKNSPRILCATLPVKALLEAVGN